MTMRLAGVALAAVVMACAWVGAAEAAQGYQVTNSSGSNSSYVNVVGAGFLGLNANGTDPTIYQNGSGTSNTLSQIGGGQFSFYSIGLANGENSTAGGDVAFSFLHTDGTVDTATAALASVMGLQTFMFSETNLASVTFTATTTPGQFLQFDNVGVSYTVVQTPLPGSLALFGLVLAGLGAIGIQRRRAAA